MRKTLMVAAVTLTLCGLIGCSKSDSMTKADYKQFANQVCSASKDSTVDLVTTWVEDNPKEQGPDGTERFVRFTYVKHLRGVMSSLRNIPPPPDDGAYLDSMYGDYEHALAILYSDPLGNSADSAGRAAEQRFASYGLEKCASLLDGANKDIGTKLDTAFKDAKKSPAKPAEDSSASP